MLQVHNTLSSKQLGPHSNNETTLPPTPIYTHTMILTDKQLTTIEDICEEFDLELRTNYSGRFMYGAQCIGIVSDPFNNTSIGPCLIEIGKEFEETFSGVQTDVWSMEQDNMGRGMIYYFPKIRAHA